MRTSRGDHWRSRACARFESAIWPAACPLPGPPKNDGGSKRAAIRRKNASARSLPERTERADQRRDRRAPRPLRLGYYLLNNTHVLKGKDDLSDRLSLIQVSGCFSNLRHRKCLVHYCPVLLLGGQSYHFIDVLRGALRWNQKDVEPDNR